MFAYCATAQQIEWETESKSISGEKKEEWRKWLTPQRIWNRFKSNKIFQFLPSSSFISESCHNKIYNSIWFLAKKNVFFPWTATMQIAKKWKRKREKEMKWTHIRWIVSQMQKKNCWIVKHYTFNLLENMLRELWP